MSHRASFLLLTSVGGAEEEGAKQHWFPFLLFCPLRSQEVLEKQSQYQRMCCSKSRAGPEKGFV